MHGDTTPYSVVACTYIGRWADLYRLTRRPI